MELIGQWTFICVEVKIINGSNFGQLNKKTLLLDMKISNINKRTNDTFRKMLYPIASIHMG